MQKCFTKMNSLRRLVNYKNAATSRHISSVPGNSKVYELRKYKIKPQGMGDFLKLWKENVHLRTKHSPFLGYWNAELGALNQVFHIWVYDDYSHRTAVRAALAEDKEWNEKFLSKASQLMMEQDNSVLHLPEWCRVNLNDKNTGVYELVTYGMKMGGPVIWEEKLKRSLLSHARLGYADLVGAWYTNIGDHNKVEVMWRFESMDTRKEGRERAHRDRVVVNTVRDNLDNVRGHSSVILSPVQLPPA